jgi:uncharacterized repeat protein (TIGR01451 family)
VKWISKFYVLVVFVALALILSLSTDVLLANTPDPPDGIEVLIAKAQGRGRLPVIVGLDVLGEFSTNSQAIQKQQAVIAQAQESLLQRLSTHKVSAVKQFEYVPYIAFVTDAAGLEALKNDPAVTSVEEDVAVPPTLSDSIPLIRAHHAHTLFYKGNGQAVAVLDTGVDKNHPDLGGKVISEACYSTNSAAGGASSLCPGGATSSTAINSGLDCAAGIDGCDHGTHVAGIAAGIAPEADLIAIQVFSRIDDQGTITTCSDNNLTSPCTLSYRSDQIAALNRVFSLHINSNGINVASVNMSLGGGFFAEPVSCDLANSSIKATIDILRGAGISTVISAGNSGYRTGMGAPACVSSAISVGATTKSDQVASYSNLSAFTTLLAPGSNIDAPVPGSGAGTKSGTSMAAPHVAGAIAILKQVKSTATVDEVENILTTTGANITDQRTGGGVTKRRLDVYDVLCQTITCDSDDYRTIQAGQTQNGSVNPGSDRDHYFYNGTAGERLTVRLNRSSGSMDPYLELYDPTGIQVALNNNGGSGSNALINGYILQQTGRYLITTRSINNFTGSYTLQASREVVNLNPVPYITRLSPSSATGSFSASSFWVAIYGRNFTRNSEVRWNGQVRPKYYSHSGLIWIWVYGSDIGFPWPRIAHVTVRNPSPGGGYSNPMPFSITSPFLGESKLLAPEPNSSVSTGVKTSFAISWTHPISSWHVMQNMDLRLRDENDRVAAWIRLVEGSPTSTLRLLNAAGGGFLAEEDGFFLEGLAGEDRDLVLTDTVTLHLAESAIWGSGRTVIMTPTVTFGEAAIGTYNIEFRVDNDEGEIQDDDVLGTFTIQSATCGVSLAGVDLTGVQTGTVGTPYAYTAQITPTNATTPITYTWAPEPDSGEGSATAIYSWPTAGQKAVFVGVENCGTFVGDVHNVAIRTTDAPDLSIYKTGPAVALAGEPITYTLTLSNSGGSAATNLTVLDQLPEGANYVTGGTQGSATLVGDNVLWTLSEPLDGYGAQTQVVMIVTASATITNSSYSATADGGHSVNSERIVTTHIAHQKVKLSSPFTSTLTYDGSFPNHTTTITMPGGSVFDETTVAYTELPAPTHRLPEQSRYAGRSYKLDGYQYNRLVPDLTLGETMSVTLTYNDDDVTGLDENKLALHYWNGSQWSTSGVTCELDSASNQLACQIDPPILAEFALLEIAEETYQVFVPLIARNHATTDSAHITDIAIQSNDYVVYFETYGFTPEMPGQHVHFFFDTVPPEQAGVPGSGPWFAYGGASPFTGYGIADRPEGATQMCILVANPDHSVQAETGNCYVLP